jgi:hypothetical protein
VTSVAPVLRHQIRSGTGSAAQPTKACWNCADEHAGFKDVIQLCHPRWPECLFTKKLNAAMHALYMQARPGLACWTQYCCLQSKSPAQFNKVTDLQNT